jgi:glycosyltransferase involved in cell wall biosynthesis
MHIVYIHTHFEGHFEPLARGLASDPDVSQTFLTTRNTPDMPGIHFVPYAIPKLESISGSLLSSPFERSLQIAEGARVALQQLPSPPDVILSYAGFGCSIYAPLVFPETPVVGYFPYYYLPRDSEIDFLPDYKVSPDVLSRLPSRNAAMLVEHAHMRAGYSPTHFQASRFPRSIRAWLDVFHDGIDSTLWSRRETKHFELNGVTVAPQQKVISYAARGLELYRGFDRALDVISAVLRERQDTIAFILGKPQCFYGNDSQFFGGQSLRHYLTSTLGPESSRIHFIDWVSTDSLIQLFSRSNLHLYFTVPYTLSWSLLNAMSCEAPILASNTAPVLEVIQDGQNGVLADYFDTEEWVIKSLAILSDPVHQRALGLRARQTVESTYSTYVCIPNLKKFLCSVAA